jgi:hypothetical protein
MCEDAKKEMEQLIQEIRTMLEEDADIKRLFIRKTGAGPQVEIAGVGKVSLEEAEKLVGKDVRWSRGESDSTTIDDLINGLKETTNGKGIARNFEASGGYEQTLKDFEALNPTNVKDIQTKYGAGKVGILSDGTKVVARQGSTTGGATLEIKVSNSKVYKVRY